MELIKTAISSHQYCFVCKNNGRLRVIKNKTILDVYNKKNIYIKPKSRCCEDHLDDNGELLEDCYNRIITRDRYHDKNTIIWLKYQNLKQNKMPIFDKFKNIKNLNDSDSQNILGLDKNTFERFCSFIKIKNSKERSKYQVIAIYLYWLKKGVDQKTLSYLKSNSTQQRISNYLFQARKAIHKDFVSIFLGANRTRDQFLKHNTIFSSELHNIQKEKLVVIADGTYCRIEKSANNNFQYKSYSSQKKDNLFKPFIFCCADGYIIDCYGPFEAKWNDAKIIKYILEKDNQLKNILEPNKTVIFLDRGNFF